MATDFSPWASLFGGALIGLAAVLLMGLHGRVMGVSGLLSTALLSRPNSDSGWRFALLAGMLSGPALLLVLTGSLPVIDVPVSNAALLIGGLLVGMGVSLGSGCTSGHGVCGIARLSRRSILATLCFMATAVSTVFVIRHLLQA